MTDLKITEHRRRALTDALEKGGHIWETNRRYGSQGPHHHDARVIQILAAAGLLTYESGEVNGAVRYAGGWALTAKGRALALTLPDKEGSASRQYYIDHGRYLRYDDREEFQIPTPFKVGQWVQAKGRPLAIRHSITKAGPANGGGVWYDVTSYAADGMLHGQLWNVRINPEDYVVIPEPDRIAAGVVAPA